MVAVKQDRVKVLLIFSTVFLLPFDGLPYFNSLLREISYIGSFYPLLVCTFIFGYFIFKRKIINFPGKMFVFILTGFVLGFMISFILNYVDISQNVIFNISAKKRYLTQSLIFFFGINIVLVVYEFINTQKDLHTINKSIWIASMGVASFAIFEYITVLFSQDNLNYLMEVVRKYIFATSSFAHDSFDGIHTFSREPSWFGMYLSLIYPFLVWHAIVKKRFFLLISILVVCFLTYSRTAYALVVGESLIYLVLYVTKLEIKFRRILYALFASFLLLLLFYIFNFNSLIQSLLDIENNSANIARYGAAFTAINIFFDYPIFGIGIGQFAYYAVDYIPTWAMDNFEIRNVMLGRSWPVIHNLYARVFAEFGIFGFTLWCLLFFDVGYKTFKTIIKNQTDFLTMDLYGYAIMTALIGVFIAGLNRENFSFMGYWLILGLGYSYYNISKNNSKITSSLHESI